MFEKKINQKSIPKIAGKIVLLVKSNEYIWHKSPTFYAEIIRRKN